MQYTTNYNLLLPEGTDIVNPLTDTNPNFSTLDTQLKSVSDKTVSSATEVTVGTAHALTRSDTNCNVFTFTATSNWTAGDTISVDGTPVTALKTDGTTLQTGDYVIGANVLCILQSTRLTVFVSSATISAASGVSYNNTSSGLTATNVQDAIDENALDLIQLNSKIVKSDTFTDTSNASGLIYLNVLATDRKIIGATTENVNVSVTVRTNGMYALTVWNVSAGDIVPVPNTSFDITYYYI